MGKPGKGMKRDMIEREYKVLSLCVKLFLRQEEDVLKELQRKGWAWVYTSGNGLSKPR